MPSEDSDKAVDVFDSSVVPDARRERPFLLPHNRRLRHLQGISVRNLTLNSPRSRNRGQTIDDESLPQTWKSPAKLLAQRENGRLGHSRSSTDLTKGRKDQTKSPQPKDEAGKTTPTRPSGGKLRRRSTLNWTGASPGVRQRKLEDVTGDRMADTFFSIHCEGVYDPVYISEVIPQAMNPSFRLFDLNGCGPHITRLDETSIKLWAKSAAAEDFSLLVELHLNFKSLQFIGKEISNFHHTLPQNCIVFHLSDGLYTSFTDLPIDQPIDPIYIKPPRAIAEHVQPTSSYDALMRLSTLDDCIQDALATRMKVAEQINHILEQHRKDTDILGQASEASQRAEESQVAVQIQKKEYEKTIATRDEMRASLQARRQAMQQGLRSQKEAEYYLDGARGTLKTIRDTVSKSADSIQGQRRRVCEDLIKIYPIEPVPNESLSFTICGLHLPNSSFDDADENVIAAALGYVSHLLILLSSYLSIPLPYPITISGSNSTISDPIAIMSGSRTYPLFLKNSIQFRFDYGVFLLNKNLELLMSKIGLKPLDIRQTLPNLKYLLYVLASGTGELPARKAGGIRGLLGTAGTPTLSRRGSEEEWEPKSTGEDSHGRFIKSKRAMGKFGRPAVHSTKASGLRDVL